MVWNKNCSFNTTMTTLSGTAETIYAAQMQPVQLVPATQAREANSTFSTILDAVNPLQHIPVVSNLFRAAQGSPISAVSQIAGDTLYGGLLGGVVSSFISSLADVAVKEVSGKGIGEHVLAGLEAVDGGTRTVSANATPLVPLVGADVPVISAADTSLNQQAEEAAQIILRTGAHPERVAGQYQRAQTLDITNNMLVKGL
jgi:hypothetical protein